MTLNDAAAVTALSHQLGYPLSIKETTQNIEAVINSDDKIAFVTEYNDTIVGWINASQSIMIEVMPYCEINGLVVDENYHGKGIGKLLIERVKQWAKEKGNNKLSLRCNVKRIEAHKFYNHLGFRDVKKQTNFVLEI
jgi:GNAT superfamily N-acetyltransferase